MHQTDSEYASSVRKELIGFLNSSPCNFYAVRTTAEILDAHGFTPLDEKDEWNLEAGGKYYVVKNSSAIFAFIVGSGKVAENGFRIISAHTDSPGFKIKPNCEIYGDGRVVSLNVEKYGGPIMYTWFDRPLSVAGRVMLRGEDALHPVEILVDLHRPVATVPHLAIHFNRAVNEGNSLSVQKDMKPVVGYFTEQEIAEMKNSGGVIRRMLAVALNEGERYYNKDAKPEGAEEAPAVTGYSITPDDILDYELMLYPCEEACAVGVNSEFLQSGRIDDLSMAYCGIRALLDTEQQACEATRIVALFDNEETGSGTKQGAASPVLRHIVERLCAGVGEAPQDLYRAIAASFMISADDAHGWHPNYNDKYDPTNHPVLGGGPVVKINANCKYMTDARGAAVFHSLCQDAGVNMQYFVNHSDVAGGSTLGNISSQQLDLNGVDVGCAIWAMHSARETAAFSDHVDMIRTFRQFFV
ncbi:MAG: M18 family aminopeptidase [Muribaculaceae bacterium]|nr:M18 family aminopeptidase [Muribaculaceae bacterium]